MLKRTLVLSLFLASLVTSIYADDKFITQVALMSYNVTKAQCDNNPNGTIIYHKKLKYCAISGDALWCIPMGSVIEIDGYGRYKVVDTIHVGFNYYIDTPNYKIKKIKVTLVKKPKKK